MFIIKFLASIFFFVVLLAVVAMMFFWNSIRNIKRQFDRLGGSRNASPDGNHASPSGTRTSHRSHRQTNKPIIPDDEGEYVDFEEAN